LIVLRPNDAQLLSELAIRILEEIGPVNAVRVSSASLHVGGHVARVNGNTPLPGCDARREDALAIIVCGS
jgi:hypothetical protein